MALYAISDLHLALDVDKPMDIFGEQWIEHEKKIKSNWLKKVKEEDTVLIAGDISWSMKMEQGIKDLDWINELTGRKILIKGNHDYWWNSISKLNSMYDNMCFIQNNFFQYEEYAICGTRGWLSPFFDSFQKKDEKIYNRELARLRLSLEAARKEGFNKYIVMLHYPPINDKLQVSDFAKLLEEYKVEKVMYGHLHQVHIGELESQYYNGIEYMLVSSDFLNFDPKLIFS